MYMESDKRGWWEGGRGGGRIATKVPGLRAVAAAAAAAVGAAAVQPYFRGVRVQRDTLSPALLNCKSIVRC